MADHATLGIETAYARARVPAMASQTCQVGHTIAVHQTFGPTTAGIRVADVRRYAHTFRYSVAFAETLSVVSTRRRVTRIPGNFRQYG